MAELIAKYEVSSKKEDTIICYEISGISSMYIDGVEVTPVSAYTFPTLGEHTVIMEISDNTSIPSFLNCYNLSYLEIPDGVTSIGDRAFQDCYSLLNIVIPNSVTSIGVRAFYNCRNLRSVTIPSGVTSISDNTFNGCARLTSVTIPDSVTSIGEGAFSSCSGLTSINIPENVTSIGQYAFSNCPYLRSVTIPSGVTSIGNNAFTSCTRLTSVTIPDSVTSIGEVAFASCSGLTSINIPENVTSIGQYAFGVCINLRSVTCQAATAPTIDSNTFHNIASNGVLYYPCGSDYSSWLSTSSSYLGSYGWTSECFNDGGETTGGTNPSITINSTNGTIAASGGTLNVEVTYPDGSTLTVSSDSDWLEAKLDIGMAGDGISTDKYFINVSENTTTSERIGVITFSIGNSSVTYTVTQDGVEEEPENPDTGTTDTSASISLNFTSGNLPSGGGSVRVKATTTNNNGNAINVTTDDSWITLEKVSGETSNGTTIGDWRISASSNSASFNRVGIVTFSYTNIYGDSASAIYTLTQAASNTPEDPDTGTTTGTSATVTTDKTSITVPSTGTTDTITVTYGDASVIRPPIFPNWVNVEVESSEVTDAGTAVTYKITVTSTTETAREDNIIFSATSADGQVTTTNVSINQMATTSGGGGTTGDTTGSTSGSSVISPFITTLNLNASATTFSITVGYKNITTILEPSDNANWISYTSSGNVTSSYIDYDKVYKYNFTVTPNTSSSVKTATITFVGDNTTAYTAVIQAAYVAPEEPEPDIPSSTEVYYGPIWKDVEFSFGGVPIANYTIWKGNNLIFSGRSCMRPNATSNTILVNKVCQNYLSQPELDLNSVSVSYALTPFYLKNEAGTTTYKTYYFVNDWSYSDYFNTGLLSHPIRDEKYIYRNQWCPFTIFGLSGSTVSYGIKYDPNKKDEYGNAFQDYNGFETARNEVYTEYFKALRNYNYAVDSIYIGNTTYKMKDDCNVEYVLYYVNPWGGYDWFPIKGRVTQYDDVTQYTYTQNYNNTTLQFGRARYLSEIKKNYVLNSGWLNADESTRMWYLLESNIVYLHNLRENKIYPVIIKDTKVEEKKRTILSSRINYVINVELSQIRERL